MDSSIKAAAVVLDSVSKSYGAVEILKNVSVTIAPGEVVTLLGPSGAGKSTLLRCINHLETIGAGRIYVHGKLIGYREVGDTLHELSDREISAQRRSIGMVFQSFNLFRHMTVLQNVMSGPTHVLRAPKAEAEALARDLLARVGLPDKADRYPSELSGGQQQRVAIARTLALAPSVMLFDEPTSALDPELSQEVILTIRSLAEQGYTMLIATHEMAIARDFADRVIFMVQGEVVEDVSARSFFTSPRHERSRQFVARHAG
ncbi:polar amino acid transport system ATP-binding protein [Azospirillum agricola]|uniref:amino acid ABC transporter ATP-binding protein n=1 Tax=Azospirillum agricola TaxID=1720247 RepID=UPI001AE52A73|nr:amino acid ABC transporter ATP-binding protein [Azospirillum agricola]MBP2231699.1 polar amino acid transport system ATP-binding protein [Azospirillum agricola]